MQKIKTIIILGPTSSGKSDLAVELAKKLERTTGKQSEIISVDSRQIYKDMNLGTGKVEGVWRHRDETSTFTYKDISHHLIDFQNPCTHSSERGKYTVVHFRKDALRLIKDISRRDKIPMIVGGTGFWISSLIDNPQFPEVMPNEKLRANLKEKTTKSLFEQLQKQDPQRAATIDSKNKHHLIRALEICQQLGKVPKSKKMPPKNIEFLQIGLDWSVEKLAKKIKKRLASRWTDGMIDEIKNLKTKHAMKWHEIQAFGLAYHWIPLYLQNKLEDSQGNIITNPKKSKQELLDRVYFAEKKYAKQQRTWFKKDRRIIWTTNFDEIVNLASTFIS